MIKYLSPKLLERSTKKESLIQKKSKKKEATEVVPRKKKALGQNFLRKQSVVDHMIAKVTTNDSIMEIGCGDGFLTQSILQQTKCQRLWCFEVDNEWLEFVKAKVKDPRLTLYLENILELDWSKLLPNQPWTLLANLPYQITFPILFKLQENKHLFKEGVVMVQEEVGQKLVARNGRSCNVTSLFLQHHFDFELMEKIEPGAFNPPPKVFSRLVYFKPKLVVDIEIKQEKEFWKFLKFCYRSPRQTLKNNLRTTDYKLEAVAPELLSMRAQQCSLADFLKVWNRIIVK